MTIKSLLQALTSDSTSAHISEFGGKRIAIDGVEWLQKGMQSCVEDIVDMDIDVYLYIDFVLARARNLRLCGVEPVFVFSRCSSNFRLTSDSNSKYSEIRQSYLEQGQKLVRNLKNTYDPLCRAKLRQEAIGCFQKGLAVTHDVEISCLSALRKLGITCVVAPYEASAQMAFLCHVHFCQAVLTNDSDVLVYSAVCGTSFPVLYRFEKSGQVQSVDLISIGILDKNLSVNSCPNKSAVVNSVVSGIQHKNSGGFQGILRKNFKGPKGRRMFIQLCILGGCDYVDNLQGISIVNAQQIVLRHKDIANDVRFLRIIQYLQQITVVPNDYLNRVLRAEALFHYQSVYDPYTEEIRCFSEPPCPPVLQLGILTSFLPGSSRESEESTIRSESLELLLSTPSSKGPIEVDNSLVKNNSDNMVVLSRTGRARTATVSDLSDKTSEKGHIGESAMYSNELLSCLHKDTWQGPYVDSKELRKVSYLQIQLIGYL